MNSHFLLEKLESSDEYKRFIKENPKAYLCSGFFIIDMDKNPENKYHFDFYVPENKKTFSFELEKGNLQRVLPNSSNSTEVEGIKLVPLERNDEKVLEKVSMVHHFDFDELKEKTLDEMASRNITNKIQKLIFSLQSKNKEDVLLGTIFVSGFALLKFDFDIKTKKITNFEKKSFFDMMKIVKTGKK